jgi:hypothetical protein
LKSVLIPASGKGRGRIVEDASANALILHFRAAMSLDIEKLWHLKQTRFDSGSEKKRLRG